MKFFFQRPFEGSVSLLILIRFSVVSFFMNVPGRRTLVTGHIFISFKKKKDTLMGPF